MAFYKVVRGEIDKRTKLLISGPRLVWQGTDTKELEKKLPRLYFTNGNTLDELRTMVGPESATITIFFFREKETDNWTDIQDPRTMVMKDPHSKHMLVMTAAEIAEDLASNKDRR